MDEVERLFKEAERIEPPATLWRTIAARTRAGHGAVPESSRGGEWVRRMAASLVLGLAVLAAYLLVSRDSGKAVLTERPRVAVASDGTGAEGWNVAEALPDEEILAWHADLGEESAGDWDEDGWTADDAVLAATE